MKKWLVILVLPIFTLIADFKAFEETVKEYNLDNGLTLLVLPRHEAPVVSFVTLVKVGSGNEPKGFYGIAHIFEHMAFKGTPDIGTKDFEKERLIMAKEDSIFSLVLKERKKAKPDSLRLNELEGVFEQAKSQAESLVISNQYGEIIEREGGVFLNAGTSHDATTYFLRLPSNKLELWMSMESERFISPVFREFYTEVQGPIAEERREGYEDQPTGRLLEKFTLAAFPENHPYGHPVIGFMDDILTMTREKAESFFRSHYVPDNIIIAIVGDVDPQKVLELAKIYWGRLPKREPPPSLEIPEIPKGEKRVELKLKSQPWLFIGFHRPSAKDPQNPVYNALADYLGRGRTSLLYKTLVKEKKLATHVYASAAFPGDKYSNLFWILAIPAAGHTALECENAIYDEIKKLKAEPVPEEELRKVKARAKANIYRFLERDLYTAMLLAMNTGLYGDWREVFRDLERLDRVTPLDLQKTANDLFIEDKRVVGSIVTTEEEK